MNADDLTFDEIGENRFYDLEEDIPDPAVNPAPTTTTVPTQTSFTWPNFNGTTTMSTGTATGTKNYSITIQKPPTQSIFSLSDLGIATEGSFDSNGSPTGWIVNHQQLPIYYPVSMQNEPVLMCEGPSSDYIVKIRGIFSRHFTNERRAAMGLQPI